mgnify:CR=1 FL=1
MWIDSLLRGPRPAPLGYPFVILRSGARFLCYPAEPEQARSITVREVQQLSVKFQCLAWVCWSECYATVIHPNGTTRDVSPTPAGPLEHTPSLVDALTDVVAVDTVVGLFSEIHRTRMEYGHPDPAPVLRRHWEHVQAVERSPRESFAHRVSCAVLCEGLRVTLRHAQPQRSRIDESTVHWMQQVGKTLLVINERLGQYTA